jgi:hypothetical protein
MNEINNWPDVTDRFPTTLSTTVSSVPVFRTNAALYKALLKAQPKIEAAIKDSSNPHFRSKYADINSVILACKEQLNAEGIVVLQPVGFDQDNKMFVKTILVHAESGESIESRVPLMGTTDMQKLGSAITYARRYGLQSLVLLGAEDDDAESTMDRTPAAAKPVYQKPAYKPGGAR